MQKFKTKSRSKIVVILLLVLVLVLASDFILNNRKSKKTGTSTKSQLLDCTNYQNRDCYYKYYEQLAKAEGSRSALQKLKAQMEEQPIIKAECHQLAHIVGREAYAVRGNLADVYQNGDAICWSGYYHGAVEQAIKEKGNDYIVTNVNDLCKEVATISGQYSFNHYNCVHGVGHGVMMTQDYDVFVSLQKCANLTDTWEAQSCYGGVFMENHMVDNRVGASDFLRPGEPMYPCTAIEDKYQEQCYLTQSSYVLSKNGYNFGVTFAECAKVSSKWVATCYMSIGRDASGSTNSEIARTRTNCDQGTDNDMRFYCMIGAARDFVAYYHSDQQANQFCQIYPDFTEACLKDVAELYKTF